MSLTVISDLECQLESCTMTPREGGRYAFSAPIGEGITPGDLILIGQAGLHVWDVEADNVYITLVCCQEHSD